MLRFRSIACALLISCSVLQAQNLVPNPSFELIDACPSYPTMLGFQNSSTPLYWQKWEGSPDYFNACEDTIASTPGNIFGVQAPYDGAAYVGMFTYGGQVGDVREHIGAQLTETLEPGHVYYLSFRTNAASGTITSQQTWTVCNHIGFLFTTFSNAWNGFSGPVFPARNYAHLQSEEIVADTANWVLVSGSFVADSAYSYLAIGNFFDNAHTDTLHLTGNGGSGAYAYVDAICVSASPGGCDLSTGFVARSQRTGLQLFPNPASTQVELTLAEAVGERWVALDLLGREQAHGWAEQGRAKIDVGEWSQGSYVLMVGGNKRTVGRLVVVH